MYIYDTIVIGAGPAGLSAAIHASSTGKSVLVLEKNEKAGKKIFISGKGRGNVCNACDAREWISHIVRNPHFLHSAYARFGAKETMSFFESQGVKLVVERGKRVFPESGKAYHLTDALVKAAKDNGVSFHFDEAVRFLDRSEEAFHLKTVYREYWARHVVIATGGLAYPSTGSTGDGYRFSSALGHRIVAPAPALCGLKIESFIPRELRGFTLKNVSLRYGEKKKEEEFGEITFREDFVDGPIALTVSSLLVGNDFYSRAFSLDLKPALSLQQLDERLARDIAKDGKMRLGDLLVGLMPSEFLGFFAEAHRLDLYRGLGDFRKDERLSLAKALKAVPLRVVGTNPFERAIVTAGGVDVSEVNSSTMESRLVSGLYFAGELLNVDGLTGGFNMQIALSTGALAGESIAQQGEGNAKK